jgi:hypothetical protein
MTDEETVLVVCPACKGPLVDAGGFKRCDSCHATWGEVGKSDDPQTYDDAPSVHPDASGSNKPRRGSGKLRLKDGEIVATNDDLDAAARLALHFWIDQPPNPGEVPSKEWLLGLVRVINTWTPVTTQLPPPHETVLARDEKGDIYQARVCFGMHAPWWCGHSGLNFGVILQDKGITITAWRHHG